jgi:metal-responsive CopG/Arc/MetJ family transcriptional regulator
MLKSISLKEDLWAKIDKRRGEMPRSRFVAKLLADSLASVKKKEEHN